MTEELKTSMIAINKWMFHGWNYESVSMTITTPGGITDTVCVPQFLKEVKWTCHISHMLEKWRRATRTQDPDTYMTKFYADLDDNNRKLLLEWVVQNYNGERPLFS